MGFDAGAVVEPLDYDFTKFGGSKGTIPEPSDKAIDQLFKDIATAMRTIVDKINPGGKDLAVEEVLLAMADLPEAADIGYADMMHELAKAFAKLCQNQPPVTQMMKLPLRIRMRFFTWLVTEIRPEDFGAATRNPAQVSGPPAFRGLRSVSGA